jgi:hypothetical protein
MSTDQGEVNTAGAVAKSSSLIDQYFGMLTEFVFQTFNEMYCTVFGSCLLIFAFSLNFAGIQFQSTYPFFIA